MNSDHRDTEILRLAEDLLVTHESLSQCQRHIDTLTQHITHELDIMDHAIIAIREDLSAY